MTTKTPTTLEQDLTNLLEEETSVLSPVDAPELARSLMENLPPKYDAAQELLQAVEGVLLTLLEDGYAEDSDSVKALESVKRKARGENKSA